jgi:hypothetical protein
VTAKLVKKAVGLHKTTAAVLNKTPLNLSPSGKTKHTAH